MLRYIHQNPVKAKLCENVEDYRFSSYNGYTYRSRIVDTDFILDIMPLDEFTAFNHEENTDKCLEVEEKEVVRLTDEQARAIIKLCSGCVMQLSSRHCQRQSKRKILKNLKTGACQYGKSAG